MFIADTAPVAHLPALQAKDLNGRMLALPKDLPGDRTIAIVALQREQQANVDTWTRGLKLPESSLPWLELPVIDDPGAFARWFIAGGMRRGIRDHTLWQHVVTLYTRKADLKRALEIANESTVYVLVLDREGRVVERVSGDYSPAGAEQVLRMVNARP